MKIAFVGNMNNMLFQTARYWQDEGHEVTLFLLNEFEHFLPSSDYNAHIENYKIVKLGWSFAEIFTLSKRQILKHLGGFDFYMGIDLAAAFLFKAGLRLDISVSHGTDLFEYPFLKFRNNPPQYWEIEKLVPGRYQFQGLKEASLVSLDPTHDLYEDALKTIKGTGNYRICSPVYLYLPAYEGIENASNEHSDKLKGYSFIVFQHVGQEWDDRGKYKLNKGNDKLIRAFSEYLKEENYSSDSVLVLFEYGSTLKKSKELVEELGIQANVIWMPKMLRKDLMVVMSKAHICVGQMGERYWYGYSSIFEYMAVGKPVVHYRNDDYYRSIGSDMYPMFDANTSEQLLNIMLNYRKDPSTYEQVGKAGKEWLLQKNSWIMDQFGSLLEKKKSGELRSNKIDSLLWKKIRLWAEPIMMYACIFLFYYKLKNRLKVAFRKN